MDKNLKNKTFEQIQQLLSDYDQQNYLAEYVFSFIQEKGVTDIEQIMNLSKDFRSRLISDGYFISTIKKVDTFEDPDGTVKYLFELPDGDRIETVIIFDKKRTTLCISTQVGCSMGCKFCATAGLGFKRNLGTEEIVEQVNLICSDGYPISNVVYMGMGEPLLNYDNVINSVNIISHPKGRGIGLRRITVSTCGLADKIKKLADEDSKPQLAVSLNAPDDEIRSKIMPVAVKYPVGELLDAVHYYNVNTSQRVTFEYVMLAGVNDSDKCARELIKKISKLNCKVNIIEFNPYPGCEFEPSDTSVIRRFAKILSDQGIPSTIRLKQGDTIKAACGQLGADLLKPDK
jgi:23S rRNA (adenine2503-C2)-methyltransferase